MLENIIRYKRKEIERQKKLVTIDQLQKSRFFSRETKSLKASLLDVTKTGIITEYKRKTPLQVLNATKSVESVTRFFTAFGASALSIVTDYQYYGGSLDDLVAARDNDIPIIRRDFILDEYQLFESKAYGCDAIVLMTVCLEHKKLITLARLARELHLEVVLFTNEAAPIDDSFITEADIIGLRHWQAAHESPEKTNLLESTGRLNQLLKIAGGGIRSVEEVNALRSRGFDGVLIGRYFMEQEDPGDAFKEFTYKL